MNRREFIQSIGLAASVAAVDPQMLLPNPRLDFYRGYPPVHFNGFLRNPMTPDQYVGQFLWKVLWDDGDKEEVTDWYQNATFCANKLFYRGEAEDRRLMLRQAFERSLPRVSYLMDHIAEDAMKTVVQLGTGKKHKVQRVKIVRYEDGEVGRLRSWLGVGPSYRKVWDKEYSYQPSWDVERLVDEAMAL